VSRNFEILRRHAGESLGRRRAPRLVVKPVEDSTSLPGSSVTDHKIDWLRAIIVLQKHWRLSALFALLVMVTVGCVTYLTTPVYEATARIEIDPPGEVFSLEGGNLSATDAEYLETQAHVLQSDSLAIAVIRKLGLDQNPYLVGAVKPEKRKAASAPVPDALQLTPREKIALGTFEALLKVRRDTSSRLILVSFENRDPQLAATVSNTLVQSFVDQNFETRHEAIMKSTEWLSHQLDDIRIKMEDSSRALAEFQQSIGVVDVDDNRSTFAEHMGELSRQLTQAQAERIQLQALLKNVESSNPDSLPEVRSNPVVQQLSQALAQHRAELAQVLVVYGKNYPMAKKLQSQVDELQSQLDAQKSVILNSLKASYAAAHAREGLMAAEMKGTSHELNQMARYTALKKEVQANVELYNSLYARIKEAGISAASKSVSIRIVDQARVPDNPSRPRRLLNLSVGLLAALFGGVVLAFVCEEFDNKLRSPEDIRRWIGRSDVSIIPVIGESDRQDGRLAWSRRIVGLLPAPVAEEKRTNMFLLERPDSPEAEALQALYASVVLSWAGNPPQVLLIASAFPGEGKTTVALNLACALAKHAKTCLVDADLRKNKVARAFGLPTSQGLRDVLAGVATLDDVLLEVVELSNLSILPAGKSEGNAGQLVCSAAMQQVLRAVRQRFEFVVIDSAPILPFVDGRALSTLADALVLVGRAGITTRQAMRRSVELLSEVHGAPILQVVLNGADLNSADYKYRYGYASSNLTT